MDSSQVPAFQPWKGSQYDAEGLDRVRLLILGEAQYAGEDHPPRRGGEVSGDESSTQGFVRELGIQHPEKFRPFWTKVAKLVRGGKAGEPISKADREDFWNRVAFYNYIQWWMPRGRSCPTEIMWTEARDPFSQVIHVLSPHVILVLGLRLSKHLPPVQSDVVHIKHPASVGFSYASCTEKVRKALDDARKRL
jgi:hypothetical protein